MDDNILTVAIYSRKSRFTGKGDSVENQIDICREYVRMHFIDKEIKYLIYEDEGYSGSNMRRPGMSALLSYAKKHDVNILICYRLDRVSRSVSDFSGFIEMLGEMGIKFISVRENFDTTTPMGRAMLHIASVFAQLERETIAERITDSLHRLAKMGYWLGGEPPTGYKSRRMEYIDNTGKKRFYYSLVIDEREAVLIKYLFEQYIQIGSLNRLSEHLKAQGVLTKNKADFGNYSLRYILTNPVYCVADMTAYDYLENKGYEIYSVLSRFDGKNGLIAYSKNDEYASPSKRRKSHYDWIVAVGYHEGIIDSKRWCAVQELIKSRSRKNYISGA